MFGKVDGLSIDGALRLASIVRGYWARRYPQRLVDVRIEAVGKDASNTVVYGIRSDMKCGMPQKVR